MAKWKKRKGPKMTDKPVEAEPEMVKQKVDETNDITLEITRPPDGSCLQIYIRAPMVARIVNGMADSNYARDKYAAIYKDILKEHPTAPKEKGMVVTKKAITQATKSFVGGTDFSFSEPPRAILLANAEALAAGYTLTYKVDQPVPMDMLKKWGKQFSDGCKEIIANARPFKMSWVMSPEKQTK